MTLEKPRTESVPADPGKPTETTEAPAKKGPALNVPGLLAGAATAATMAVLGGHLSVAGTVLGAALTSLLSGVAVAVYSTSIEKSRYGLQKVRTAVSQRVLSRDGTELPETHGSTAVAATGGRWAALRPRVKPALVSTGVIIGLAVAAIFGIQALTGTELSGGTGTIQRSVTGSESVAVRTADTTAPGAPVGPDSGVAPMEGTVPTAEATADAPTDAGTAPVAVDPTSGAVAEGGTTTPGGALPGAQDPAAGQTGTDGGDLGSGASPQQGDAGAAPAAP
ncbi:hypothetical protein ACH9EU_00935 [Kocuria sp. M1R5S2]|uniref:hypothetical protein n=1 Tax=Kocuria rhizosphaerae TaxID=3376285 RepID=UPI0037B5FC65